MQSQGFLIPPPLLSGGAKTGGIKRVKIINFKDDEKFITCTFEYQNDHLPNNEDLHPLSLTAIKRLEKLSSINKKVQTETINNIKQLKESSKIVYELYKSSAREWMLEVLSETQFE